MTPEEHRILVETREMVEENNKILKRIQLSNRAGLVFKVIYWVVILGASFGAYYLIQPYVDMLKGSLGGISDSATSATDSLKSLQDLYK